MSELTGAVPAHLMDRPEVAKPDPGAMGKDDFMVLLMAQLRHQDPLNPMDHKEFSAQLAQFASLEKLTQIGSGIEKLEGGMGEESKRQALGLIGKRVQASGREVELQGGQSVDIRMNTQEGFTPLKVSIFAGDGKLVREMDLPHNTKSDHVSWDGKDQMGDKLDDGKYHFRVAGVGADGKSTEMAAELDGKVIGVEMSGATPNLVVQTPSGQTRVELDKVIHIKADEPNPTAGTAPSSGVQVPGQPVALSPELPAQAQAEASEEPWPVTGVGNWGWGGGGR